MIFEAMSSTFVARGIFDSFDEKMADYRYEQPTLNPLNLGNIADDYEKEIIAQFNDNPELDELTGYRSRDGEDRFYVARPILVEQKCLQCHGQPDQAPAAITKRYGREHGFDWKVGEAAGALIVSIPTADLRSRHASLRYIVLCIMGVLMSGLTGISYYLFSKFHDRTTDLVSSQSQLANSEARLHAMLDSTLDPMITIDSYGMVQGASHSVETVFGWKREELVGQNVNVLMPEPYRSEHDGHLSRYRNTDESSVLGASRELEAMRRDGTTFPCVVTLWKVDLPNQSESCFMGTIRDITQSKEAEAELEETHQELMEVSRLAGMSEVATGVLHNIGNVLNSVNVSAHLIEKNVRESRTGEFQKSGALLAEHVDDMAAFVTDHPQGQFMARYMIDIGGDLIREQSEVLNEVVDLRKNIDHIKNIVAMQQSFAKVTGVTEILSPQELFEDALRMRSASLGQHSIEIIRKYEDVPSILADRHTVIQILVNLLENAIHAISDQRSTGSTLSLRLCWAGEGPVRFEITDSGIGMSPETLQNVFTFGFTTKKDGHGFGLHTSALAASEMEGSLTAHSDGEGLGATFVLECPAQQRVAANVAVPLPPLSDDTTLGSSLEGHLEPDSQS